VIQVKPYINPNPIIYPLKDDSNITKPMKVTLADTAEVLDPGEIYDIIRHIKDPEHPYTLEQLNVVQEDKIQVDNYGDTCIVRIEFMPTVPHCSLATLIGLCLRVKLERNLPIKAKIDIYVTPGKHSTANEINRQINDKERIQAALENPHLLPIVEECIKDAM